MKHIMRILLLALAICAATLVCAAPSPSAHSLLLEIEEGHVDHYVQTLNVSITLNDTFPDVVSALGYDHSKEWQNWATVEVWIGGSKQQPVNFGDTRGRNLSDAVFGMLSGTCPPTEKNQCTDDTWKEFWTNGVTKAWPNWKVEQWAARVRTESASWATGGIRTVMAQIAADTLRAYVSVANTLNCYEVTGPFAGIYCNVPQFVRVNLPTVNGVSNHWHIETWGIDKYKQFEGTKGLKEAMKPCHSRHLVDNVIDKYKGDILQQFPNYKDKFSRDARVIINGAKACSNEP